MNFEKTDVDAKGIRISIAENAIEVGRAYLYLMKNDLQDRPFGLMEDVHVEEAYRGTGIGSKLVRQVIEAANALRLELPSAARVSLAELLSSGRRQVESS